MSPGPLLWSAVVRYGHGMRYYIEVECEQNTPDSDGEVRLPRGIIRDIGGFPYIKFDRLIPADRLNIYHWVALNTHGAADAMSDDENREIYVRTLWEPDA